MQSCAINLFLLLVTRICGEWEEILHNKKSSYQFKKKTKILGLLYITLYYLFIFYHEHIKINARIFLLLSNTGYHQRVDYYARYPTPGYECF